MRRIILLLLAAAFAAPGCADSSPADTPVDSVVPYFADRTARFPGRAVQALDRIPVSRLRGIDGPTTISMPDGGVVYPTFEEKIRVDPSRSAKAQGITEGTVLGRDSVRISSGSGDRLLVDGAFAPAVSPGGRVAVGLLDEPDERYGQRDLAAIAVVEPGTAQPIRWTGSGALLTPVAWAGESLVYAVPAGMGLPQLRLTTGPGTDRQLAPRASFVAAAPDGRRILIATEEPGRGDRLTLEIRSTVDGQRLAAAATELRWAGLGSWTGSSILVVGAPEPGQLAALEFDERLGPRRTVGFAVPAELASPPNEVAVTPDGSAFGVATFVAGTRAPNVAWVILSCTLATGQCRRADLSSGVENTGFVTNPSV